MQCPEFQQQHHAQYFFLKDKYDVTNLKKGNPNKYNHVYPLCSDNENIDGLFKKYTYFKKTNLQRLLKRNASWSIFPNSEHLYTLDFAENSTFGHHCKMAKAIHNAASSKQ